MNLNYTFRLRLLFISVIMIFSGSLSAQLSFEGEFRPRTELRNGYRILHTSDSDPAFFISQRTRLNLLFNEEAYQFKLAAQDVRTWGDEAQIKDNANLNIHEVWAEIRATEQFKIKLGRQELVYDDQRLLGSVNWSQIGRSHDAILVKYQNEDSKLSIDLGGAYNQQNESVLGNSYTLDNYKLLSYLWMNKKLGDMDLSGMLLMDGFETIPGNMNYRYTYGTHLNYKINGLVTSGSAYLQKGDDKTRTNISAYMIAGKVSYKIRTLNMAAGIDYLSGGDKDDADPGRYAFNTLYATNHKFYGNMDYFLNIPNDTKGGGLQDIYANLGYTMSNAVQMNLSVHNFSLAKEIIYPLNSTASLERGLGTELDISGSYTFGNEMRLQAGYSILLPTDSLEQLQQVSANGMQQWGWVMLVLTPEFFTGK